MAKSKKLVLVGKATYGVGNTTIKKGESVEKSFVDGLPEHHKAYFTDEVTAVKVLKRKIVVSEDENEEEK